MHHPRLPSSRAREITRTQPRRRCLSGVLPCSRIIAMRADRVTVPCALHTLTCSGRRVGTRRRPPLAGCREVTWTRSLSHEALTEHFWPRSARTRAAPSARRLATPPTPTESAPPRPAAAGGPPRRKARPQRGRVVPRPSTSLLRGAPAPQPSTAVGYTRERLPSHWRHCMRADTYLTSRRPPARSRKLQPFHVCMVYL